MTTRQAAEAATADCHYFSLRLDDEHAIDLVPLEDHMRVLERWIRQAQEGQNESERWRKRCDNLAGCSVLVVLGSWLTAGVLLYMMWARMAVGQ